MSIEIFRKMVNLDDPKINIEVRDKYGNGIVIIEESDISAGLKKVTIAGLDIKHTFAFKLDPKGYVLSPFLSNNKELHIKKVCDGVIFGFVEGELIVYLCELKSGRATGYINKFRSSEAFICYLEKLAKEFFDFNERIIFKRLLFDQKKVKGTIKNKTPTNGHKLVPKNECYNPINGSKLDSKECYDGKNKSIEIYFIHHLEENEYLNVRHLA